MKVTGDTRMGPVHLTVGDLGRSVSYYENAIGLQLRERENGTAHMGGREDLLVLHEERGAEPARAAHSGLFHFALLVPDRAALAQWLLHAAQAQVPISGASDHLVSEAIYLRDPDGHGIEIYRDRPRSDWVKDGDQIRMATLPLDLESLVGEAEPGIYTGLPEATTMGHVHLQVADVEATEAFYGELGFEVMTRYGTDATFMSVGGYHHHLGGNTWAGRGVEPAPAGTAAMRHATMIVPGLAEEQELVDPSGIRWLAHG